MPVKMFKHKQVHWEATRSAGRGRSVGRRKWGLGGGKGGGGVMQMYAQPLSSYAYVYG